MIKAKKINDKFQKIAERRRLTINVTEEDFRFVSGDILNLILDKYSESEHQAVIEVIRPNKENLSIDIELTLHDAEDFTLILEDFERIKGVQNINYSLSFK